MLFKLKMDLKTKAENHQMLQKDTKMFLLLLLLLSSCGHQDLLSLDMVDPDKQASVGTLFSIWSFLDVDAGCLVEMLHILYNEYFLGKEHFQPDTALLCGL